MNAPEMIALNVSVSHPTQANLERGPFSALSFVEGFVVDGPETWDLAAEELRNIVAKKKQLDEQRKGITRPMDEAKNAVMSIFNGPVALLEKAEKMLKAKMLDYQTEQQRKAQEAAREAERIAQEERAKLAAQAKELEAQGNAGEAEVVRTVAEMVVAAPAPVAAPVAKGISTSTTVDFEVDDTLALVKHIAAHPELIGLVVADSVKLRAYVRGLGLACKLPGVRVFTKQTMSARKA